MRDEGLELRKVSISGIITERNTPVLLACNLAGWWMKMQWLNLQRRE